MNNGSKLAIIVLDYWVSRIRRRRAEINFNERRQRKRHLPADEAIHHILRSTLLSEPAENIVGDNGKSCCHCELSGVCENNSP
jgi:hypothetical protein